jgi:hypothetical protein
LNNLNHFLDIGSGVSERERGRCGGGRGRRGRGEVWKEEIEEREEGDEQEKYLRKGQQRHCLKT